MWGELRSPSLPACIPTSPCFLLYRLPSRPPLTAQQQQLQREELAAQQSDRYPLSLGMLTGVREPLGAHDRSRLDLDDEEEEEEEVGSHPPPSASLIC